MALADAAGSALGVDPAADATLNNENRTLVVGSDIFIGDLVKTGPKGQVQILFADNTELVVGPSSALTIEDTGEGIPPHFMPHLFETFSQADTSAARRHLQVGRLGALGSTYRRPRAKCTTSSAPAIR